MVSIDRLQLHAARIERGGEYFAFAITHDRARVELALFSAWVTWGSRRRWERRAAGLIQPQKLLAHWQTAGPATVVNTNTALRASLASDHRVAVLREVVEDSMPALLEIVECVAAPLSTPLRPLFSIPRSRLQRAPSKALRMAVLRRDGFRCLLCGRHPADYVDIELHVHHVLPFAEGGLTELENLVTLCHTCHCGLDPHNELQYLGLIRTDRAETSHDQFQANTLRFPIQRPKPNREITATDINAAIDDMVKIKIATC